MSVALPILRGAADEDREDLVDLWARLLANAMDPNLNSVRQSFIDAVKGMDPLDAVVLRYTYETQISEVQVGLIDTVSSTTGVENIAAAIDRRADEIEVSLRHLQELLLFDPSPLTARNQGWTVNPTSRELLRACYPEVRTQ